MLDTITPQQFNEWIAFEEIEPDQTDRMRTIITTGFLALAASWGMEIEPKDLDPLLRDAPAASEDMTPEQAAAAAQLAYRF